MAKIILQRTGEPTVSFEGKRILFESTEVGCAHFEFHGYRATAPVECFVLSFRENRRCRETRDVAVFDDRASLEKGLATAKGGLAALSMLLDLTSGGDIVFECTTCPWGEN